MSGICGYDCENCRRIDRKNNPYFVQDDKTTTDIKRIQKENKYTDMILSLIDDSEEMTRSDLQGCIQAIVVKIISETKKEAEI